MVAIDTDPTRIAGAAPQKLTRRRSIFNSLRKGLRRNQDLPDVATARIQDIQESGPPLLRRRSSNPELRPKTSRRAIASLPRQQTLKRSESEKRAKLEEVPSVEPEKRADGAGQRRGWSASAFQRQRSPKPTSIPSASAPHVTAQNSGGRYGTIDETLYPDAQPNDSASSDDS
jgi:hypothetical protein